MLIVEGFEIKNYSEKMTNDELYQFCLVNRDIRIERDKEQNIIIMSPVGGESGFFESEFIFQIKLWVKENKNGYSFSSSTGFLLPNGAMRSPDASWISENNWAKLSDNQKEKFLPIVPDFIVEVRSSSDPLPKLKNKMLEWLENGTKLAWLIDSKAKQVYIYRPSQSVETIKGFSSTIDAEEIMPGFKFDLTSLKLP